MPLMRCTKEGKTGLKWGENGTCYTGRGRKAKAERQGRAIEASKAEKLMDELEAKGASENE